MIDLHIAVSERDWASVREALFTRDGKENAGVLLCGSSTGERENRLLVRRFWPVPPDSYARRESYHLEITPRFYNQVVDACLSQHLSPVIIHSHPHHKEAWYSESDDYGEGRLMPVLQSLLPHATIASLIVTPSSATGRVLRDGGFSYLAGVKILGLGSKLLRFVRTAQDKISARFERQVRAFGIAGQETLQRIKVGVIGVGGTGSLVVEQLARAGLQDLIIVDHDEIEDSNISRLYGTVPSDIGKSKVNVISRHALRLGVSHVQAVSDSAIRQDVLLKLRDRDVVFSCVDNDRTRAILNRFAYQYLIPLIEIGTRLDGRGGEICAAAGRVVIAGAGLACLRCSHHLNSERIRAESLPESERIALQKEGYVIGIDEAVPSLVSLNTVVAGLGVTAVLNMFLNLTGGRQPVSQLYDGTTGTVFVATDIHEEGCDVCDTQSGVKGLGDQQIVSAYD